MDNRDFLQLAIDHVSEGIFTIGLDGLVKTANAAALKLLRASSTSELIGKNSHDLIHHTRRDGSPYPQSECPIYRAMQDGKNVHLNDEILWRLDGTVFNAEYSSNPVFESGRVVGTIVTFQDISEQKSFGEKARNQEAWFQSTLSCISDAVITIAPNESKIITFMNPAAVEITGWTISEALGKPLHLILRTPAFGSHRKENSVEGKAVIISKKGQKVLVEQKCSPILSATGECLGMVIVLRNITEEENARRRLEDSEAQLKLALDSAQMGTWNLDLKTNRTTTSKTTAKLFGVDGVDENVFDLISWLMHPDDQAALNEAWQNAVASRSAYSHEYRIIRPDGVTRWMLARGRVSVGVDGNPDLFSGILTDVTDQKDAQLGLEFEKHKLSMIFQESPVGMALIRGTDFSFEMVNPTFSKLLGGRDFEGKSFHQAIPELLEQPFLEMIKEVYRTGRSAPGKEVLANVIRVPGGAPEKSYWDFIFARVDDALGKPYGVYVMAADVTESVVARQQITSSEASAKAARREAEVANHTKSAFLANMSHEIRTPLSAIIGFASLLEETDLEPTEQLKFIRTIQKNGSALAHLIDDILDLAKVESGKLEINSAACSLQQVLTDIETLFEDKILKKRLKFKIDDSGLCRSAVITDQYRVRQVLINLVGNALKFTEKGMIVMTARSSLYEGKVRVEVEVEDSGIGMSEDQRKRLFQPFSQASAGTAAKYGGTGLGLSLSKSIANRLGGDVTILKSVVGRGTSFLFSFEGNTAVEQTNLSVKLPSAEKLGERPLDGLSILLADDSSDNQFLIKRILTKAGAEVMAVDDGVDAVAAILNRSFDLVLMDIQMPRMDGYEASMKIRESGSTLPIIALTAHAMTDQIQKIMKSGFSGHIAKPVNPANLAFDILSYVDRSKTHLDRAAINEPSLFH